jgi:cytochrome c oxidase assembly factor CtaG
MRILAHGSGPLAPGDFWLNWSFSPLLLLSLFVALLAYDLGTKTLWTRAGRGHGIRIWQTLAFKCGLAVMVMALVSPLDALSGALFSAHMIQHLLLLLVAAPLFAMSAAPLAWLWALPLHWRRWLARRWQRPNFWQRVWGTIGHPLGAGSIFAAVLWLWHVPLLYEAALASEPIHTLEHGCFLAASGLFWWALLKPGKRQVRDYGLGVLILFVTGLHSSILSALLVFSNHLWYASYASYGAAWGLTPLADQQLAGLIMWLPMGLVYLGAAAVLLSLWLNAVERNMQRHEHRSRPRHEPLPLLVVSDHSNGQAESPKPIG